MTCRWTAWSVRAALAFVVSAVLLPASAMAQDAETIRQGTTFGNSIAPSSASQLVNPAAVNAAAWGAGARSPTSIPAHLGAFSTPNTSRTTLTTARATGLTGMGTQAMVDCANFVATATSDPLQVQACAAVNFISNACLTPTNQQSGVLSRVGVSQQAGTNCAGTYGQGVQNFNMASQVPPTDSMFSVIGTLKTTAQQVVAPNCTTQNVVTTPAQYALNTCTTNATAADETCSQFLNVSVTTTQTPARTAKSCPTGTLVGDYCQASTSGAAEVTYVCPAGQTLQGNMCIGPNGSTPAIVASYTCPAGQTLSGTDCVDQTTTVVGGAAQTDTCPVGSTWNGTACESQSTAAATYPTGVLCYQNGYGRLADNWNVVNGQCVGGSSRERWNEYGCPGLTDFVGHIAGIHIEVQDPYKNGVCHFDRYFNPGDPPGACPVPDPSKFVLQGVTTTYGDYADTSTGDCSYVPATRYSCPSGSTLDTHNNCVGATTTTAIVTNYFCPTGGAYANGSCTTTITTSATITYSCPTGQTLAGTQCTQTTVTTAPATPGYSCPSGGTLSGTNCITDGQVTTAAVTYSCPAGGVLSGNICTTTTTVPATITYSCVDGSPPQNGICRIKSAQSSWTDTCGLYESSAGSMLPAP